jgi:hypothetical protein
VVKRNCENYTTCRVTINVATKRRKSREHIDYTFLEKLGQEGLPENSLHISAKEPAASDNKGPLQQYSKNDECISDTTSARAGETENCGAKNERLYGMLVVVKQKTTQTATVEIQTGKTKYIKCLNATEKATTTISLTRILMSCSQRGEAIKSLSTQEVIQMEDEYAAHTYPNISIVFILL